jgi:hypothetical protein
MEITTKKSVNLYLVELWVRFDGKQFKRQPVDMLYHIAIGISRINAIDNVIAEWVNLDRDVIVSKTCRKIKGNSVGIKGGEDNIDFG